MYFLLAGALGYFRYLKIGLSVVLVFVGVKMLIDPHGQPPQWFQLEIPDRRFAAWSSATVVLIAIVVVHDGRGTRKAHRAARQTASRNEIRWTLAPPQPLLAGQLAASQLKISPLLAQCLLNRGFSEAAAIEHFLSPRLKNLADPFLLPNMDAAVERLLRAREQNELLVIFGDYDVDGVTSTALLAEVLRALGWQVEFYLPNRMDEGYGLSADGVENCLKKFPVKLLLAVDCGSTAVETIASLQARGVEVIVLRSSSSFQSRAGRRCARESATCQDAKRKSKSFHELCSAGLAFKLAHALVKRGREIDLPGAAEFDLQPLLDLVALGTIADLVPLTGENRILVSAGLEQLERRPNAPEFSR